jgi:uncharacterized membrane protein YhhN
MLFPGGIEGTANATLILSVAAAVIYALIVNMRPMPLRTAVKTLAVSMLAVLVFVENGPALLFGALVLSACGDALLSRDGDRMFLAGLASFLAAHGFYIALFLTHGAGLEAAFAEPWRIAVTVGITVLALVMLVLLWRRVKPALRLPVLAYEVVIVAMGLATLTMGNLWIVGGALLFIASDGLLASERFIVSAISPHRPSMRLAVWVLYYAAQVMIALGFLLRL